MGFKALLAVLLVLSCFIFFSCNSGSGEGEFVKVVLHEDKVEPNDVDSSDTVGEDAAEEDPQEEINYAIEEHGRISDHPATRLSATRSILYVGEYSMRRRGGYEHNTNNATIHWSTNGVEWHAGQTINGVESINGVGTNSFNDGVNIGTEPGSSRTGQLYSLYDNERGIIHHRFGPIDGHGYVLGLGNSTQFGEIAAFGGNFGAGIYDTVFVDENQQEVWGLSDLPKINGHIIFDITEFKGWILAAAWDVPDYSHKYGGSLFGTRKGWAHWQELLDPARARSSTINMYGDTVIVAIGNSVYWTNDPGSVWDGPIDTPGIDCHNLIQVSTDRFLGIFFTSGKMSQSTGLPVGVWLVEIDIKTYSVRTIEQWSERNPTSLPYWTGGDIVKFGSNSVAGFITISGESRSIIVRW